MKKVEILKRLHGVRESGLLLLLTVNSLLSSPPPLSLSPPFKGKKVNKLPLSFMPPSDPLFLKFFTSKLADLINH